MASCITAQWSNAWTPQVRLTVTESSSTGNTSTLSWTLEYVAHGYAANAGSKSYTVKINGDTVKTGTYNIDGVSSTKTITSGTKTITKTTSAQSISFSVSFAFNITWSGVYGGTKSASGSMTVPAKTSYTISYNANGGSGAPSNQTKWYDTTLILSSTKPTRAGHSFQGWATSASGSVAYAAGASYTANAAVTLYAVWKANTYAVKYNANGGSGAPSDQTKTYGVKLTLSSTKPTRANYTFLGWATSASATSAAYSAGGSYTANAAVTLYAVWKLAYVKPKIYNFSISRCDADGNATDNGEYALVKSDWETTYSNPTIKIVASEDPTNLTIIATGSGTSGSISEIVSPVSTEMSYTFTMTVTDSNGKSQATRTLSSLKFAIDCLAGGGGIAFGKASELDDTAEFAYDAKFNNPVYGKALGMDRLPAIPSDSDLNNYMDPGCYAIQSNAVAATCANIPVTRAGRLEVWSSTGEGVRLEEWSYLRQRFVPYNNSNAVWERDISRGDDNAWSYGEWWRSTLTPAASKKVYHEQKILWGGDLTSGMYMTAEHTIDLTEAVSAQPNGIVLVFSAYNGTDDTNYSWQSFFVPKRLVAVTTSGHTFTLSRGKFSYTGTKYLYIYDTYIAGHADNNLTGTSNGITYANDKFVLRYVIGV